MFGCSPGTVGFVGHSNWGSKYFDETDHKLFKDAAILLVSVPEGKRIVAALKDVQITFIKASLGTANTGLDLGNVGHSDPRSSFWGAFESAEIEIDLYKIRGNVLPESQITPILAWVIYHELRHTEATLIIEGERGRAIDRALDYYFYPSEDRQGERLFISQAKIPFKEGKDGKMVYPLK